MFRSPIRSWRFTNFRRIEPLTSTYSHVSDLSKLPEPSSNLRSFLIAFSLLMFGNLYSQVDGNEPSDIGTTSGAQAEVEEPRFGVETPFRTLGEAVDYAGSILAREKFNKHAVLIYRVRTSDRQPVSCRSELLYLSKGGVGRLPGRIRTDEPVARILIMLYEANPRELRIFAPGYDLFSRQIILRRGDIIVWDDIVLQRLTASSGVQINGVVDLEDWADPNGIVIYLDGEPIAIANEHGEYSAEYIRSGELRLSAHKRGYVGLSSTVTARRSSRLTIDFKGYRERYALVRWTYTSDPSRQFTSDSPTLTEVLSPSRVSRLSFRHGPRNAVSPTDIEVSQDKDKLLINFTSDTSSTGVVELPNTSFDQVYEAPALGYLQLPIAIRDGGVYVFRTRERGGFAKMEVVKLTDQLPVLNE